MPPRVKKNEQFGNPFDTDEPPFETEPPQSEPDEAQAENVAPPRVADNGKKSDVQVGSDGKITVTLKAGRDFDAPWVVLHGQDSTDLLTTMSDPEFPKLLTWTTKAAQTFGEGWNPSPQGGNTGNRPAPAQNRSQAPQGQPPAATQHPRGERKFCQHGEMVFKSDISKKTGKPWYAFDCPSNVCQREFVKI